MRRSLIAVVPSVVFALAAASAARADDPPPPPTAADAAAATKERGQATEHATEHEAGPAGGAAVVDVVGHDVAPDAVPDLAGLDLGVVVAIARRGDVLYLALQAGGIAVVDVGDPGAPRLVRRLLEDRAVSRLVVDGEQLVAVVLREDAVAYAIVDPFAPALALPGVLVAPTIARGTPLTPRPTARGVVVDVIGGRVVFDGGADAGFVVGQRVRVSSQRLVEKPDLVAGGTARLPSGEVTAVVAVEAVEQHRAMAVLGRGDVAAVGDVVEVTDAPLTERLLLPPRAPVSWRFGFHARPFFGLESDGFPIGALVDGYVHWMPRDLPVAVLVEVAPAAGALLSATPHYPVAVAVGATYVTDWFEVGLGGGALVGNEGPCEPVDAAGDDFRCEVNTGFTFNQFLRLGALDGLHLQWSSSIFARSGGFVLGTGRGELAVPVSSRVGLYAAGGVGENGWALGEIGVRSMLGGTGGPGTTILSASLGAAGVFDGPGTLRSVVTEFGTVRTYEQESVAGPAVGFGMEWRL
jgi:hypothetical protein